MTDSRTTTAIINPTGFNHVRLSVSEITASKAFYVSLLGSEPVFDFTSAAAEPGVIDDPERLFGGCIFSVGDGQVLGLRPVKAVGDRFDPTRVGLDHLSLSLPSMDDLRAAVRRLDAAGVVHGEIIPLDDFGMAIVSVQDPDDINLELSAPL